MKKRRVYIPNQPELKRFRPSGIPKKHVAPDMLARTIHCEHENCGATFRSEYYRIEHESRFHGGER